MNLYPYLTKNQIPKDLLQNQLNFLRPNSFTVEAIKYYNFLPKFMNFSHNHKSLINCGDLIENIKFYSFLSENIKTLELQISSNEKTISIATEVQFFFREFSLKNTEVFGKCEKNNEYLKICITHMGNILEIDEFSYKRILMNVVRKIKLLDFFIVR